jgi:hypothetical protein
VLRRLQQVRPDHPAGKGTLKKKKEEEEKQNTGHDDDGETDRVIEYIYIYIYNIYIYIYIYTTVRWTCYGIEVDTPGLRTNVCIMTYNMSLLVLP